MQLGFIGTGEITSSIVTGLSSFGLSHSIWLSPRNPATARDLAERFSGVTVGASNQEVVDHSETVVIAVRPPVVRDVLSELRFRTDHHVISLVSGLSLPRLHELVAPAAKITRAVPVPSTAQRLGPTAIYPADGTALELFAGLGNAFAVDNESVFEAICAATATVAFYFAFNDQLASWLTQHGVPASQARDYIGRVFFGVLAEAVAAPERSFRDLATSHATIGGTNEQFLKHLTEDDVLTSVTEGLDAILRRITRSSV